MDAIVAVYSDWGIGANGTQPVVLRADRVHFKELTTGAAVIVGRRTLGDFPGGKPLKNRVNIVVSTQNLDIPDAVIVHDIPSAIEEAKKYDRCLVIGGAGVYRQFYPYLDRVYITKIDLAPHSDAYFPNLDESDEWICSDQGKWENENDLRYCFCTYERRKNGKEE